MLLRHLGSYHCHLKQLSNYVAGPKHELKSIIYLAIPLTLAGFTHLWNPTGFPTIHTDEGYYIGRSIHVSEGLGPKEDAARYDHPYFGWLVLGSIFSIINYPDSANPTPGDVNSINMVWFFPRVTMGIFAVVDTFLVYKIADRRYGRTIAFIAATLFAVMPYTWLIRRALIEPIQLPFLLTSILFALYTGKEKQKNLDHIVKIKPKENGVMTGGESDKEIKKGRERKDEGYVDYNNYTNMPSSNRNIILLLASGVFLGLTIFAKIPAISLIPVVGFIVFTSNKNRFQTLGIWIIPVILIPLIWPVHALYVGDIEQWQDGLTQHITREDKPLLGAIDFFYNVDPVLLILGLVSFVFVAATRKDFIFLIWVIPFLALLYAVNYVSTFHLIPLIPAFCIGTAVMIKDLSNKITKKRKLVHKILPLGIVSAIAFFGLTVTTGIMINANNLADFDVIALVTRYLPASNEEVDFAPFFDTGSDEIQAKEGETVGSKDEPVTIVGHPNKLWILKYVFDKRGYDYKTPGSMIGIATLENARDNFEKILIIADEDLKRVVSGEESPRIPDAKTKVERISDLYNNTKTVAKTHNVEIRINY